MRYPQVFENNNDHLNQSFSPFFSLLQVSLDSSSSNMKIIFGLLDELVLEHPQLPVERYLKGATTLLNNVKERFVESRSIELIKWLINVLSENTLMADTSEICPFVVKMKNHLVEYPFQSKETCSVVMTLKTKVFDKDTLSRLVRQNDSELYIVEGTFFLKIDHQNETVKTYFEVQKNEGLFSDSDAFFIEKKLPKILIEEVGNKESVWIVPSNRELLMKNFHGIMKEMNVGDFPQVFIDFTKQTHSAFHFSVLVCSLGSNEKNSLKMKLSQTDVQVEGTTMIKEGSAIKEGIVASIEIPFNSYLSPIDARKKGAQLIRALIGPFRDINGGLLEKVEENFVDFATECGESINSLKPFFYSITPQELQATAPIPLLLHAYSSLKMAKEASEKSQLLFYEKEGIVSICVKVTSGTFLKGFKRLMNNRFSKPLFSTLEIKGSMLTCCTINTSNFSEVQEVKKQASFYLRHWLGQKEQKQILRISSNTTFTSFDPRIGTDEATSFLHRLLFSGLMQINSKGEIEGAIAKDVQVFDGGKHYRFHLRKSYWSDGSLLTAKDFIYSWKTSLNPGFFSLLTHFFYPIKNGQKIKEGSLSSDFLGVDAPDSLTLDVFLEYPCSYFLELCAHPVFSPILMKLDKANPNWTEHQGKHYICNGGFLLENVKKDMITLTKNPHYWNANHRSLEKIELYFLTEEKSLDLFKKQQIDALLRPLSKCDTSGVVTEPISKKWEETLETKYLCFNCKSPIFSNHKIRRAISNVIDRKSLAQEYSSNSSPHFSPYSPYFTQLQSIKSLDVESARALFEEGLQESSLSLKLIHSAQLSVIPKAKKLGEALVKQINKALNLSWKVVIFSPKEINKMLSEGKIEVTLYSWNDKILNPSYFLEIFSSFINPVNCSLWNHLPIQKLIQQIRNATDNSEKKRLHKKAEEMIQELVPIAPLFVTSSYSVTQPYVLTPTEAAKITLLTAYKK